MLLTKLPVSRIGVLGGARLRIEDGCPGLLVLSIYGERERLVLQTPKVVTALKSLTDHGVEGILHGLVVFLGSLAWSATGFDHTSSNDHILVAIGGLGSSGGLLFHHLVDKRILIARIVSGGRILRSEYIPIDSCTFGTFDTLLAAITSVPFVDHGRRTTSLAGGGVGRSTGRLASACITLDLVDAGCNGFDRDIIAYSWLESATMLRDTA